MGRFADHAWLQYMCALAARLRSFLKPLLIITQMRMAIGRATYQPGWKWSVHVRAASGAKSCMVEHVGMVISGCATAAMDDGRVIEMRAGDVF